MPTCQCHVRCAYVTNGSDGGTKMTNNLQFQRRFSQFLNFRDEFVGKYNFRDIFGDSFDSNCFLFFFILYLYV